MQKQGRMTPTSPQVSFYPDNNINNTHYYARPEKAVKKSSSPHIQKGRMTPPSDVNPGRHLVSPCKIVKENATTPSHSVEGGTSSQKGDGIFAVAMAATRFKRKLMDGLLQNLEEAEAFWDVLALPTQSVMHRITTIEQKVFQEAKGGGMKSRVLALFYVDGRNNGTWAEWIDRIEHLLLNGKQKGSAIERVEYLEWLLEGEVKAGNLQDRLFALNHMQMEASSLVKVTQVGLCSKLQLLEGLLRNLEEAEAFWDVLPLSAQSVVHRITTIENKVFQESKEGGLKSRLLALFYVDEPSNGTWKEWIDGIEHLLNNDIQKSSIFERINDLELLVEGEVMTGNLLDRLFALNQMTTHILCS